MFNVVFSEEETPLLCSDEFAVRNGDQHNDGPFGFTVTVGFIMRGVTVSTPLTIPKLPTAKHF